MTRAVRIKHRSILAGLVALASGFTASAGTFPYQVIHRIALTGAAPARGLAFGPGAKHVYAAVGDEVRGFDLSGQPVASVKLPGQVTGLTAGTGDVLYAAVRAPARLLILSVGPLHLVASVTLHSGAPSAVLFDPIADALYVESRSGRSVTRLDPKTGSAIGTVRLRGELRQMVANGRGTLYIVNAARDALDVVDASHMRLSGEIPLAGCRAPSGLAMDTVGRRLFAACANGKALIVDADLGYTFVRLPIEQSGSLRAVFAFHPLGSGGWKGGVFIAGDAPALDAIRMNAFVRYADGGRLPLGASCTALALSPAAGQLWLAVAPHSGDRSAPGELWVLGQSDAGVSQ